MNVVLRSVSRFVGQAVLVCCALSASFLSASFSWAGEPLIKSGDRVALIGGTLIESMQTRGDLEVAVVLQNPELRVPFRNLGWSGDDVSGAARRVFGGQPDGYARLMKDLEYANPTVAVLGYGFAEAANGLQMVPEFEAGLRKLAEDLKAKGVRLVFVQPFAMPGVLTSDYLQAVAECRKAVEKVAAEFNAAVLDPGAEVQKVGGSAFDRAGLRLSDHGQELFGHALAGGMLGIDADQLVARTVQADLYERISGEVTAKNELFFHRHRPMNETYLFLFRKHEQGNNAVEVDQFETLVQQAEQKLWDSLR